MSSPHQGAGVLGSSPPVGYGGSVQTATPLGDASLGVDEFSNRTGASTPLVTQHHSEIYYRTHKAALLEASGSEATVPLLSATSPDKSGRFGPEDWVGSEHPHRRNGVRGSIATLMNSAVGASLLVLPYGTYHVGL